MVRKKAILEWIPAEFGGRHTGPPVLVGECPYSTMVRLPATGEPWPSPVAWSLVVRKLEVLDQPFRWVVEVQYLVESAPHHLLAEGTEFELYEGKQCVARGRIID